MKKSIFVFLILFAVLSLWADNYKIMKMNSSSIKIGNRMCKPGDTFSDKSIIYWTSEKQAIKAQNERTKKISLFAAPAFKNSESRTVKEYYVKNNHLSTRGGLFGLDDLAAELGDTLYLWERMKIESPYQLDSVSYFYLSFNDTIGILVQKLLECDQDSIVFDKSLFDQDYYQNGIIVNLRYSNTSKKEDCSIKDSLFIYFIPDEY